MPGLRPVFTVLLSLLCLAGAASAQTSSGSAGQVNRIADAADLTRTMALTGHKPAWAIPAADAGPLPDATELPLTFVLSRSPERQAAFEQMLADQQNPASPRFHHFLSPAEIGEQYGPTQHDLEALTAWLTSQGLTVSELSPSHIFVTTRASAGVNAAALGVEFHRFHTGKHVRFSATGEPSLPAALAPLIQAIDGLSESTLAPQSPTPEPGSWSPANGVSDQPNLNSSTLGVHYIAPGDFAVMYDTNPLLGAGINGAGQHVAIIGRSRVASSDLVQFEGFTGLPINIPNTIVPPGGVDPGTATGGDESEAALDLERVIGTAPQVTADLVISGTAGGYDGIFVSAKYNVQTLLDPVMTISFGACEINRGLVGVTLWDNLFSQAAAEGISVFVSSADSAADTCAQDFSPPAANQLLAINYICASQYATCVGGTELADTASPASYWAASKGPYLTSALGYIPEGGWNEPYNPANALQIAGSGGGVSLYVAKPAWQTGTGVPNDGFRDVPDIAFPGAGHGSYYFCNASVGFPCTSTSFYLEYGTSAAAPGMAGVTALLNQKAGRQGNLNPLLYQLAATPANNVFHDVTVASSGVSGCTLAVPSMCNNSNASPSALTGGLAGYAVQTGYDQVTGWGSLDVTNFVNAAAALTPAQPAAADPVFSVASGLHTAAFTVTLTDPTQGATIYYTLDGSTPTTASTIYTKAIAINGNVTVKAYATAPGYTPSSVTTAVYASSQTTPTIKWTTPAAIPYGTALSATQLNATASVPGTFEYLSAAGTVLGVGTQILTVYFYPSDSVTYFAVASSVTLTVNKATPAITWPASTAVYPAILTTAQLDATSPTAGIFTYKSAVGTTYTVGGQTLSATFTPTDTTDYNTAPATTTLTVTPAPLSASASSASRPYGSANPSFTAALSGAVNGDIFTVTASASTATVSSPAGVYPVSPVIADSAGRLPNYTVNTTPGTLTVTPVPLVVTASPATRAYGTPNPALTGTITGLLNADPISASFATTASAVTPVGTAPITATLADPAGRLPSYTVTNTPGVLTIAKAASSASIVPSALTAATGSNVTLTATVVSATTGTPTGVVTFLSGASTLGTGTLNSSGVAILALSSLPAGTDAVTASYAGDGNFNGSQSGTASISVGAPDFLIASAPGSATVNAGQPASFALTITPAFGLSQATTLSCSGLPASSTCSFSPSTLALTGAPATTNLTLSTSVATAALNPSSFKPGARTTFTLAAGLLLLPLVGRRGRRLTRLASVLSAVLLSVLAGCAGGSSPATTPRTPDGTYTVTVNAVAGSGASALSHSTTVSLTVNN